MTPPDKHQQHLAALVYDIGMKKQIEERVEAKYLKRIEYLVNANNELMYELEEYEKGRGLSVEAYNEEERGSGIR